MAHVTKEEIIAEMQSNSPLNRARRIFSHYCATIEQGGMQRTPLTILEIRELEFIAARKIAAELGVTL